MRYFLFGISFLLILSCGEEQTEETNNLPDWDYANVVDGDTYTTDKDSHETEKPDKDTPHEVLPDNTPDEDSIPLPQCGNNKVDENEFCDTIPVDCKQLNVSLSGIAYCKDTCKGYDMKTCKIALGDALGQLHVRFHTNYILDGNRVGDSTYREQGTQHVDTILGVFNDKRTIPPAEADDTWSIALTTPASNGATQTWIKQYSWKGTDPVYPRVEIEFSPGPLQTDKEYKVNAFTTGTGFIDGFLKLVRLRVIDFVNGQECVLAMASSGEVRVEEAWQNNPVEGGHLVVNANDIDFYRPDEMPNLDENNPEVPPEVLKYPKCP